MTMGKRRWVVLVMSVVVAQEESSSKFNIEVPRDLRKPYGYRHQEAQFGQPRYNAMLSAKLYYSTTTLCNDQKPENGLPKGVWEPPYTLMADNGDCSYVTKAKNAQRLGASALVVADNVCLCADTLCQSAACQDVEPLMPDDGSGQEVIIPAILVVKQDADEIKTYLQNQGTAIQAQLEYTIPDPDERVEWSLWTTSVDDVATKFIMAFQDTVEALGDHQFFTPHFFTNNGTELGCDKMDCGCTNEGRYCAPDPDGTYDQGISGANVVEENLRRACIWQKYGSKSLPIDDTQRGLGLPWWSYVSAFETMCRCPTCAASEFFSPTCISTAMLSAGIDPDVIDQCMTDAGGLSGPNSILDAEILERKRNQIYLIPQCIVNTKSIVGNVDTANVLNAICAGYSDGDEPWVCDCRPYGTEAYQNCIANHESPSKASKKSETTRTTETPALAWWAVLLICFSIVISMFAAGVLYWKSSQTHMRDQVRGILAEYMPLDEPLGAAPPPGGLVEMQHNYLHHPDLASK